MNSLKLQKVSVNQNFHYGFGKYNFHQKYSFISTFALKYILKNLQIKYFLLFNKLPNKFVNHGKCFPFCIVWKVTLFNKLPNNMSSSSVLYGHFF